MSSLTQEDLLELESQHTSIVVVDNAIETLERKRRFTPDAILHRSLAAHDQAAHNILFFFGCNDDKLCKCNSVKKTPNKPHYTTKGCKSAAMISFRRGGNKGGIAGEESCCYCCCCNLCDNLVALYTSSLLTISDSVSNNTALTDPPLDVSSGRDQIPDITSNSTVLSDPTLDLSIIDIISVVDTKCNSVGHDQTLISNSMSHHPIVLPDYRLSSSFQQIQSSTEMDCQDYGFDYNDDNFDNGTDFDNGTGTEFSLMVRLLV